MMKAKKLLSFLLLLSLFALWPAFSASADENAPEGNFELTATFKTNNVQITHEWYDSMDELWNELGPVAASDRYTEIKMHANWDIYEEKELSHYSCDVTLDLNGHSIIRHTPNNKQAENGGVFRISSNAQFTIMDSDPDSAGYDGIKGGVITGGASTNSGGAFTLTDSAKLIITGGTIYKCTTNEHGGAVMLTGTSAKRPSFEMKGGRIYFCQTTGAVSNCHGGAIYADQADVSLSDCKLDSCYSEDNGGAVYLNSGSLRADNVKFVSNHCVDYGGAIFISGGSLRVTDSRFASNEAKDDGGAVYVDADEGAQFRSCVFSKNKSYGAGGAIYVNDDRTFLIDTDVIANSAADYGGGVYVDSMNDIGVKGLVRIYSNSGKDNRNNLTLQDGYTSRSYLTSGGLYEGSRIGLSSTGRNVKYAEDISEYQVGYFFSDLNGDVVMDRYSDYERDAPMLASALSDGASMWVIVGFVVLAACGVAACVLYGRKKKAKEEENK